MNAMRSSSTRHPEPFPEKAASLEEIKNAFKFSGLLECLQAVLK